MREEESRCTCAQDEVLKLSDNLLVDEAFLDVEGTELRNEELQVVSDWVIKVRIHSAHGQVFNCIFLARV